jgi:hypothetical protein
MRRPFAPGTPVDARRYKRWIASFGSYRGGITNPLIEGWFGNFDDDDQDLAARVLDVVEYYGHIQIHAAYRQALKTLPGWHKLASKRVGKWRFAAMSGSAGESGDAMLHHFRVANELDKKEFNPLFVTRSELFRQPLLPEGDPQKLGTDDVVVLLDDFSGTGTQVDDAWNDPQTSFGALLAGVGKVYLVLVAASHVAKKRIAEKTTLSLVPGHWLHDSDNAFSAKCKHFTTADRERLLHYGKIADKKNPMGFGDCGFVVIFQHRPPNNTIPILHEDHSKWTGLFPRY